MRAKAVLFMLVLAIGTLSWSSAQAGVRIGIGIPIGIGVGPAYPPPYYYGYPYAYPYYYPRPVYVAPQPVYVTPPANLRAGGRLFTSNRPLLPSNPTTRRRRQPRRRPVRQRRRHLRCHHHRRFGHRLQLPPLLRLRELDCKTEFGSLLWCVSL